MQTDFTLAQLADPEIKAANAILRQCVHCGFCTATCPTYVLLGDELDGPRGRIYMIKNMLESEKPAPAKVVKHIDRCLSCLSCMTTCPASVDYQHLVDKARFRIERAKLNFTLTDRNTELLLSWPRRVINMLFDTFANRNRRWQYVCERFWGPIVGIEEADLILRATKDGVKTS